VILFAVKAGSCLRLYIRHGLRQQISDEDGAYIETLLKDLKRRAVESPEEVFEQMSHLSVGSVVTEMRDWSAWGDSLPDDLSMEFFLASGAGESLNPA
jgi:hypothetical protein